MDAPTIETTARGEESRQLHELLAQAGRLGAADTLLSQAAAITALLAAAVGNGPVDRDVSIDEASDAGAAAVVLINHARGLLSADTGAAPV